MRPPSAPRILLAALVLVAGAPRAADPPHWSAPDDLVNADVDCASCHTLHTAPGGTLNAADNDVNLCQSCHVASGTASAWSVKDDDKAQPGLSGIHHNFDALAVNAEAGAKVPANTAMAKRIMIGNVVCSTCHNAHAGPSALGGRPYISAATKTAGGGTGTCTSGGTFAGAAGVWYIVEIQAQGSQATATFRWSKDGGLTWMASGVNCGNGAPVALAPSGDGATVTFVGGNNTLQVGDRWQFYGSYPFMRAAVDSGDNATGDKFCRDCHSDWVMDHNGARTYTGTYRSHPVGVPLGVNGGGYDRAAPLDANGLAQNPGDRDLNPSNDLKLDAGGRVQCLSCHGVHYADGNTLTEDKP